MKSVEERFDAKIAYEPNTGCYLWKASTTRDGYGKFWFEGKTVQAHRYSYQRWVGPIPEGLQLDHTCRNRNCVNPFHLEPVTQRENSLRGESANAAKTECSQGHPYDEENTYIYLNGGRACRTCNTAHHARYQARKTAL